mmetsp:Transcript_54181/g.121499  ORF Transcript_54181/g.121499 Transcript_54181/m.121499 type:complete len:130 (-) Transcript_54181:909-1298(-)
MRQAAYNSWRGVASRARAAFRALARPWTNVGAHFGYVLHALACTPSHLDLLCRWRATVVHRPDHHERQEVRNNYQQAQKERSATHAKALVKELPRLSVDKGWPWLRKPVANQCHEERIHRVRIEEDVDG